MQPSLELAFRRLLNLFGKQFGAARCREIRRRLMHVEVPLLRSGRPPIEKEHETQRQTKYRGDRPHRRLQVLPGHNDLPSTSPTLATAEIPFMDFCNEKAFQRAYGHVIWLSTYRMSNVC